MKQAWIVGVALVVSACGSPPSEPAAGDPGAGDVYQASAVVLEDATHGPMLCLGAMAESYPPQCGDVPLLGWEWDEVEGEERIGDTIMGRYRVRGTFDGEALAVTEYGPPAPDEGTSYGKDPFSTPCEPPEGGWNERDGSRAAQEDLQAAIGLARGRPEFSGLWLDRLQGTADEGEPSRAVLNVTFTADLERHERDLQAVYGGPLCVGKAARTFDELSRVQTKLADAGIADDLGYRALSSSIDEYRNRVDLEVVVEGLFLQAELDRRYGEGAVSVTGALRPVH